MGPAEPRIGPLEEAAWDDEVREVLGRSHGAAEGGVLNIFATLARHPKLLKRWLVFGSHVLLKSTLSPRERELAILRIGWLCRAEYEWAQHVPIARAAGLTDDEIRRVAAGPEATGWDPFDAALLRAVDELRADARIGDTTWAELAKRYDTRQLMDLVFTVGQYNLVSMALNSFGVPLESGAEGFPE